ncbi:uncharacterized [Tachysurus ichikawai]
MAPLGLCVRQSISVCAKRAAIQARAAAMTSCPSASTRATPLPWSGWATELFFSCLYSYFACRSVGQFRPKRSSFTVAEAEPLDAYLKSKKEALRKSEERD